MEVVVNHEEGFPLSEIAKLVALVLVVGGVLTALAVFWIAPWAHEHQARVQRHDALQIAAIHRLGFTNVQQVDMQNDGFSNYFVYQAGACPLSVYVEHPLDNYQTFHAYIWLKGVENTQLYVTRHSLRSVPQLAACFVK